VSSIDLSICILLYNQPEDAKRLLHNLTPQLQEGVEIIIKDDSDNTYTRDILEKYSSFKQIKYIHGEKRGIDKTIIFLTEKAQGKFIWWMGDDEVMPNAVNSILHVIRNERDVNFIWANYNYKSDNHTSLAIDLKEDRFFYDRNELLNCATTGLGFISSTIFKRNLALQHIDESKQYVGTEFVNLFLIMTVITQPGGLYYLKGPIVICHPASSDEIKGKTVKQNGEIVNNGFQVFGINFYLIVDRFSKSFAPSCTRRVIKRTFGMAWRGVLVGWAGGWDTPKGKRIKLMRYFYMFPEAWIAIILFSMPSFFNNLMYKFYKNIKYNTFKRFL
jgi:glycosyltransferase involved in cell wall biosynthesis